MISFLTGISIGTTNIENRKRKAILRGDLKLSALAGVLKRKIRCWTKSQIILDLIYQEIFWKDYGSMDYLGEVEKLSGHW